MSEDSIPDFDPMQLVTEYQSTVIRLAQTDDFTRRQQLEAEARELRFAWQNLKGQDTIHHLAFGETLEGKD